MLQCCILVVLIYFTKCVFVATDVEISKSDADFGTDIITKLRDDANLDLSADEEYEDLRAELLAYHTALASLASTRRSLTTTPCWQLGGICIDGKLCTGFRFLTEVPGCKDKLKVCCFAWNRFNVRDMSEYGFNTLALPWKMHPEFGGKGISVLDKGKKKKKRTKKKETKNDDDAKKSLRSQMLLLL
ncbi:unnamed protein product [Parnassius mnemosyne]|uniref:Uncharacterized protein n=1 Tax=Parnassius mnemosyne TaxID=213953 RepID=A0AAV1LZQ5_9NEOP